jgi:hypothetical protein
MPPKYSGVPGQRVAAGGLSRGDGRAKSRMGANIRTGLNIDHFMKFNIVHFSNGRCFALI